jgi:hypothetical protein
LSIARQTPSLSSPAIFASSIAALKWRPAISDADMRVSYEVLRHDTAVSRRRL